MTLLFHSPAQTNSPQPGIDFSYYEILGPDICSLICVIFSTEFALSSKNLPFYEVKKICWKRLCAWREFYSTSCVLSKYPKEPFGTEKLSIFNFRYVKEVWASGLLGVKEGLGLLKLANVVLSLINLSSCYLNIIKSGYLLIHKQWSSVSAWIDLAWHAWADFC